MFRYLACVIEVRRTHFEALLENRPNSDSKDILKGNSALVTDREPFDLPENDGNLSYRLIYFYWLRLVSKLNF